MTDINTKTWLLARLPSIARPYALLARLDRPIGTWLLLLPGWWAIALAPGAWGRKLWLMALFGVGAVVMRGAGCAVNDLWDRRLDRSVERTQGRPLAAGTVQPWQALIFIGVLSLIGALVLFQLPRVAILLGLLTLPLIALYPLAKRVTWWPQLILGLTFNFGALIGWAAVTGHVQAPAVLLYAGGVCWTLGYDTIYAWQDRADDAKAGVKSTALLFGAAGRRWVAGFYAAAMSLIVLGFIVAGAEYLSLAMLILPAAHLIWQVGRWDRDDPASSLAMFRSNRDFGLLVLLAAVV